MSILFPCVVYVSRWRPSLLRDGHVFQSQLYPRNAKYLCACETYGQVPLRMRQQYGGRRRSSRLLRPRVFDVCVRSNRKSVRESASNRIVCSSRTLKSRTFSREGWLRLDFHGEIDRMITGR